LPFFSVDYQREASQRSVLYLASSPFREIDMNGRNKLSDILAHTGDREKLQRAWNETAAAAEFAPIPAGEYCFRIHSGELCSSKRGTPGYKVTLEVTEGELAGRRVWLDFWLTPAALPMTKRDLAKIGITRIDQLDRPLPLGILIKGKVALRKNDDGTESNRLVRFEFVGMEKDPFEPKSEGSDTTEVQVAPTNGETKTTSTDDRVRSAISAMQSARVSNTKGVR
jgi:hypothetical protein